MECIQDTKYWSCVLNSIAATTEMRSIVTDGARKRRFVSNEANTCNAKKLDFHETWDHLDEFL
jgi:hypothetical protein